MDKLTLLIQDPHYLYHLQVYFTPSLHSLDLSVLQPRSVLHILTNEVHHQYIRLHQQSNRTGDDSLHPLQISQLLLRPHADHLPGVAGAISPSEPKLSFHISVPVFEYKNGSFVYLDGILFLGVVVDCMVDVRLLSCREAPVNLCHDLVVHQFQQNSSCPFIEHLFNSGSICLVLVPFFLGEFLLFAGADFIVDLVQVDLGVQFGIGVLMVGLYLALPLLIFLTVIVPQPFLVEVLKLIVRGIAFIAVCGLLGGTGLLVGVEVE